ncbi:MAG: polysaccharide deacetylase family protein [Oscillospiraceae bacterium]|nr:polysaccharide deacetylase family protein [Oscillospiraceae bacterium]
MRVMRREAFFALFLAAALLVFSAVFAKGTAARAYSQTAAQPLQTEENEQVTQGSSVSLPVLMYHSVLKDPSRTGEYVITPEALENDLAYFKKNSYTAVSGAQVFAFVKNGTPLPEKPVMITFDDGHLNNLTYCAPLMEKYGMKCTVNVVGAFTVQAEKENDPNPYYAYLTREDIAAMEESGFFEIGCHTYNLHSVNGRRGAKKNSWESTEEYIDVLLRDVEKWRSSTQLGSTTQLGSAAEPERCVYAYPYGYYSEEGFEALRQQGFTVFLTCKEAGNNITYSGENFVKLNRYNRSGLVQTDEFMNGIGI